MFTLQDYETWAIINIVVSSISIIASLILLYKISKLNRLSTSTKIIGIIAVVDIIQHITTILFKAIDTEKGTIILGSISDLANLLSFSWVTSLSYYSYRVMLLRNRFNHEIFLRNSSIVIILVCVSVASLGVYMKLAFGPLDEVFIITDIALIMVPVIICLIFSGICYWKQAKYVKQTFSNELLKSFNINLSKLSFYPIAQAIVYSPLILSVIFVNYKETALYQTAMTAYCLNGLVNLIIYSLVRNFDCKIPQFKDETTVLTKDESKSSEVGSIEVQRSISDQLNESYDIRMLQVTLQE